MTPEPTPLATRPGRSGPVWLVGVAIVLLALNLRSAVGSVGVVLHPLRADLGMSATVAGVLTTLPVLCFALFGATTARVVRTLGLDRTAAALLVVAGVGLALRPLVDSSAAFLALTVVALAGCAIGNVVLPALAKEHFPDRLPLISSLYGAALMGGATLGSVLTVPIADTFGDWRIGLGAWAVLAFAALIPWLPTAIREGRAGRLDRPRGPTLLRLARSRLAWACGIFFGLQSAQAYAQFGWFPAILTDAGLESGQAGLAQGLIPAVGIPVTLLLPTLIRRTGDRPILPWVFALVTSAGWLGVFLAPTAAPWLWASLLGIGGCAFTWVLTMFGRRTATAGGTAGLSAFAQSVGYLVAGLGPFGTGLLHDLTGSWDAPVLVLMCAALLLGPVGMLVARDRTLEDELD
ncbi:MFS transporter [Aeromicrobium alkaliterrae]|uniref:MFS transporter n=1 Tax=Aeromicrobium alkaliterrae TaxID=302168 RepID=UPI0031D1C428